MYVDIDSIRWEDPEDDANADEPTTDPVDDSDRDDSTPGSRTTTKTGADGSKTVTVTDPNGNKTVTVTDADGNKTVTTYDAELDKYTKTTVDPKTGRKSTETVTGALTPGGSGTPKALTYLVYGLIGLSVIAVGVILYKLIVPTKPQAGAKL